MGDEPQAIEVVETRGLVQCIRRASEGAVEGGPCGAAECVAVRCECGVHTAQCGRALGQGPQRDRGVEPGDAKCDDARDLELRSVEDAVIGDLLPGSGGVQPRHVREQVA